MTAIRVPYNYEPRSYQLPFWKAFDSGLYNRFVKVWHRRAGKDITDFNLAIRECNRKPQIVTYVFPTLKMGREILWEGMDNEGKKFIDHYVPPESIASKPNDTRMTIHFKNGSIFRIGGSDSPDSLRGGNSGLFILSEWAEQDPYTWTVIRPIVLANKGKVVFNYTPKGDNHGKNTLENAKVSEGWWHEVLKADQSGVFTPEELEQERQELIRENGESEGQAKFDQEYMCSFDSPVIGSYWGAEVARAEAEGRVGKFGYEANLPVNTVWDLGVGDSNSIIFYQTVGREIRIIDHLESSGVGVEWYAGEMKKKPYIYGNHWGPHDIEVTEWGSGMSRIDTARNFGINFRVVPKQGLSDGIQSARTLLSRCYFDEAKCERLISCLKNYQRDWDKKNKVYRGQPKHDWSSHTADAFRYLAVSYQEEKKPQMANERTGDIGNLFY